MSVPELIKDDITQLDVDAIVNAANTNLLPGGGVCGAIHRAGGPAIAAECRQLQHCPAGEAVVTTGGNLKARNVIHAVGPVWQGGNFNEEELLASAYRNSLKRAVEINAKTIAFPNISTGIYGFPKASAAGIAVRSVKDFIAIDQRIDRVVFCCFDEENYELYRNLLNP